MTLKVDGFLKIKTSIYIKELVIPKGKWSKPYMVCLTDRGFERYTVGDTINLTLDLNVEDLKGSQ